MPFAVLGSSTCSQTATFVRRKQSADVAFGWMGHASHRYKGPHLSYCDLSESIENACRIHCIVEKGFVKVSHSEEDDRVRMGFLCGQELRIIGVWAAGFSRISSIVAGIVPHTNLFHSRGISENKARRDLTVGRTGGMFCPMKK